MEKNILDNDISTLGLSTRTYNAITKKLKDKDKTYTIGNLLSLNYTDLMSIRNLGKKGLAEIFISTHLLGLKFSFEPEINMSTDDYSTQFKSNAEKLQDLYDQKQEIELEIKRLEETQNMIKISMFPESEQNSMH